METSMEDFKKAIRDGISQKDSKRKQKLESKAKRMVEEASTPLKTQNTQLLFKIKNLHSKNTALKKTLERILNHYIDLSPDDFEDSVVYKIIKNTFNELGLEFDLNEKVKNDHV